VITPKFVTPLDTRQIDDRHWELLADLRYQSAVYPSMLVIPRGFVTDYASVPRAPLTYLLFGGRGNAAAVVHDFLYQLHIRDVDKATADNVFREALTVLGYNGATCWTMYKAVDLFGAKAFASGPSRYKVLNPHLCRGSRELPAPDPLDSPD
jgi:hypothetical protein